MSERAPLSLSDLAAEAATALPVKEVLSLLDLNADIDLALDLAAPIDLAVAANLNVAAPIDAAVSANVLSNASTSGAAAPQQVLVEQLLSGRAVANAPQDAALAQAMDGATGGSDAATTSTALVDPSTVDASALLSQPLLDVDVNLSADLDLAAPIAGAVAANANVAAPIDAAVSANLLSTGSTSTAVASQTAVIRQTLDAVEAVASATQTATISQ